MNEKKSGDWKVIVGGILLIAVLFMGIKFIFWGLEQVIPKTPADVSQPASASWEGSAGGAVPAESPSFCIHCGGELPDSFQWGQFCPYCGKKVE